MLSTPQLLPFELEDFFDTFGNRPGVINLASSDALPWTASQLAEMGLRIQEPSMALNYPNLDTQLYPSLRAYLDLPDDKEVLATSGAAEAIALVMHDLALASTSVGATSVSLPLPAYGAFGGLAAMLGFSITNYRYGDDGGWDLNFGELKESVKKSSAVIITNPHNPTGCTLDTDSLRVIADEAAHYDCSTIVDEVFRTPSECESAVAIPGDITAIGSLSKTYGLSGLRLGWIVSTKERIRRYRTIQQYLSLSLHAITASLGAQVFAQPHLLSRANLMATNRNCLLTWAQEYPEAVQLSPANAGTTACLSIKTGLSESVVFQGLLERGVLLIPGERCFGLARSTPWFRLGYCRETAALQSGLDKIGEWIRSNG